MSKEENRACFAKICRHHPFVFKASRALCEQRELSSQTPLFENAVVILSLRPILGAHCSCPVAEGLLAEQVAGTLPHETMLLTLAVPLPALPRSLRRPSEATPLPGKAMWPCDYFDHFDGRFKCIIICLELRTSAVTNQPCLQPERRAQLIVV